MEKELDSDVIKATQSSLGKYVKRPPLSEKLLKKPPFRFLHDIVTTVLKTTGFFEGLFDEEELISDNVKDRESKIVFLNKVISVLGITTGKPLSVKPSKIVAGQEPDKTNELLQCLAQALDKNLSSDEAVKKYKNDTKTPQQTERKAKEQSKPAKKTTEVKKLTSRSSEKLTSNKTDARDQSVTRNEKTTVNKTKQKENTATKKESPPKKTTSITKTLTKKNSVEKILPQNDKSIAKVKKASRITESENLQIDKIHDDTNDTNKEEPPEKQDVADSRINVQNIIPSTDQVDQGKLNSSYTIAETDLNSSLSSQDLMEVENDKTEENLSLEKQEIEVSLDEKPVEKHTIKEHVLSAKNDRVKESEEKKLKPLNHENSINNDSEDIKITERSYSNDTITKSNKAENSANVVRAPSENTVNIVRAPSARPSSSRPGAPRLREKHDHIVSGTDNLLVGKINVIVENAHNEEEEDTSIIIVEQPTETSISQDQPELQLSSNQHGHLVQQILDSQKEFSQVTGKTEIEWQFGAQKAREALNQEIEQLRFNIQALSRVANPLGKLLDHIQEDVEVMRQELQQWTKTYEEASKELLKQKTANEDSLFPLHAKLKQLDTDLEEKRDKINDLKIVIHKNSSRIEKLLASGNVQ